VHDGVVVGSPNFPALRDAPLRAALSERLPGVVVHVENDANCAAWGAWVSRGAREDLVVLTLGTGVGGGVITGGRLLVGAGGTGAELGHLFAGGDAPCGCGGRGCLETWCSTVGLVRLARESGLVVEDGLAVVELARAGEPRALAAVHAAADALGRGLITLVNVFNPDAVVLLGGLAGAADLLGPRAAALLERHGVPPSVRRVRLVWGGRADDLAILGAAELGR
jgi:glucokinase